MIPKKVDEKYLLYDFMEGHKDYKKEDAYTKYMVFDVIEVYDDIYGYEEYVFRGTIYELKEFIKETNYDYHKFREEMEDFDNYAQAKHIAWLCEYDKNANSIKEQFEEDTKVKVHKVHWKTIKKCNENEEKYQKFIYDFRCASPENEKYYQEYMKEVDKKYIKNERKKKL